MTLTDAWIDAAEAARALGVTRPTLYAYVSRGLIRSEPAPGATRERRYARDDVARLRRRADERHNPDKVAAHALQWGMPVLESAITLIGGDTLFYRGHDAIPLARSATVEEVASLVWAGRLDAAVSATPARATRREQSPSRSGPFIARAQSVLALASAADAQAFDLRPDGVVRTGWKILDLMVGSAAPRARGDGIAPALAGGWRVRPGGEDLIR
ncbi:MAG TPA: citrate synthase, partial [Gemmatimonadaceae bacterium]|nr:citrate synthase [Gemmatimonadaceae bacterium]